MLRLSVRQVHRIRRRVERAGRTGLNAAFAVLSRYEATRERSIYRALSELERLQRRRRGENVPPPTVRHFDVGIAGIAEPCG